jgi:hypothetical protein
LFVVVAGDEFEKGFVDAAEFFRVEVGEVDSAQAARRCVTAPSTRH